MSGKIRKAVFTLFMTCGIAAAVSNVSSTESNALKALFPNLTPDNLVHAEPFSYDARILSAKSTPSPIAADETLLAALVLNDAQGEDPHSELLIATMKCAKNRCTVLKRSGPIRVSYQGVTLSVSSRPLRISSIVQAIQVTAFVADDTAQVYLFAPLDGGWELVFDSAEQTKSVVFFKPGKITILPTQRDGYFDLQLDGRDAQGHLKSIRYQGSKDGYREAP